MMISDDEYLDLCEFGFFAKDILRQVEFHKPDDVVDFSISYLRHIQSNYHIIGTSYSYVLESIHNRRALIYNIMEALKGFDYQQEMSPSEFHFLIEALCPGFPKSLILHAATSTDEHLKGVLLSSDSKYKLASLCRAVYCHILYDEWLKVVEELFKNDGGKNHIMESGKIKSAMEDFNRNLPKSLHQPSLSAINNVLYMHDSVGRGSHEMSFDKFRREVFSNVSINAELTVIANMGKTLVA